MLNIIIFGPPGAGKGTQAKLLAKRYGLYHLSSGELLRQELHDGPLAEKIRNHQTAGELVPDKIIISLLEKAARKKKSSPGILFDGYPRSLKQARSLDRFLKREGLPLSYIINLTLTQAESIKRIVARGKTSGRVDDNRKTVLARFAGYRQEAAPLLDYYRDHPGYLEIDGHPPISEIFRAIRKHIEPAKKRATS